MSQKRRKLSASTRDSVAPPTSSPRGETRARQQNKPESGARSSVSSRDQAPQNSETSRTRFPQEPSNRTPENAPQNPESNQRNSRVSRASTRAANRAVSAATNVNSPTPALAGKLSRPRPASGAAPQRTQARYVAIRALVVLESTDRPLSAALEDALHNAREYSRAQQTVAQRGTRDEADKKNTVSQSSGDAATHAFRAATAREYSQPENVARNFSALPGQFPPPQNDSETMRDWESRGSGAMRKGEFHGEVSRGFALELVAGVCRHRARLDFSLAPLLKRELEKLDAPVRSALRLAAFERIALQTPVHVIANEYAEAMRAAKLESAVGFVNAVARRLPEKWRETPENSRGTAAHLACEYSHPLWLAKRWTQRLGFEAARELCAANNAIAPLCLRVNSRRADREEVLAELTERDFAARGGEYSQEAILVERAGAPDAWPQWKDGELIAQDEAAQLVTIFVLHEVEANIAKSGSVAASKNVDICVTAGKEERAIRVSEDGSEAVTSPIRTGQTPGNRAATREKIGRVTQAPRENAPFCAVDLCAAPGGKATHLAQILGEKARVIACDSAPGRIKLIEQNAARLGFDSIETFCGDARNASTRAALLEKIGGAADFVTLDAPCLGTGTLRRRPDAKWRKTPAQLRELVQLQRELLEAAAILVRIGGVVVYSTCSLEPEENEEQARAFLERHREYSLCPPQNVLAPWRALLTDEGFLRTSPAQGCDGAFAARFRREE